MKPNFSRIIFSSLASFTVFAAVAEGADLYWDGASVTVDGQSAGGTGSWALGSGGWEDGSGPENWADGENAIFGGTPGTVTLGGPVSAGTVTLGSSGYIFAKNSHNLTASSLIGTGGATFSGTGTLAVTGSSASYSGAVTLGPGSNAGATDIVTVAASDSLGTGTINMRGAQLRASAGGITIANAVDVASGGFRVGGSNDFAISGGITVDNASRTFANYGTGTVTLGSISTVGASTVVAFDNAQLATPGGWLVISGTISGTGQINSSNANANTRLAGANTFTGQSAVSAGTLVLANALAAQNSTVNLTGGTLALDSSVVGNAFTFGGLAGNINFVLQNNALTPSAVALTAGGNNASTTFSGVLSGPGSLTKTGTGTITLGGAGSIDVAGGINVTGGRLTLNRAGQVNLNSTAISLGTNREMVVAYGTGTLGGSITMGAGSLLGIQNGNPEGNQALRSTVNTNIVLASGSGSANAASIGGFIYGNSTVLTGTISGSGDLRWRNGILGGGSNSATISAANNASGWAVNSYTGATTFEGVNLTFSLASNANNDVVNPFGDSGNAVSITGGQLRFLQTGGTSNTTVIENNLSLSAADAATTTIFREDGNLRLDGSVDVTTTGTGNVRLQSRWGAANTKGLTLAGQLTGSGNLTITRTSGEEGSVRLANNSNTYSGTISVNNAGGGAGILVLEANGAAASAKINLASSGAHLNVNTANATITELSGVSGSQVAARSAGQILTVNQSTDTTFAGVLGGTGVAGANSGLALVKNGAGTLTLSGINTHSGTTTVAAGTLDLAFSGGLRFFPGVDQTSNRITGAGTAVFNGTFYIDLTNAAIANGNSWQLASVTNQTFDPEDFLVTSNLGGFSSNGGVHRLVDGDNTWTFTESDGTLRLVVAAGYGTWASTHAPSQTASQDFDNDGVPNGVEYVLGGTKDTNDLGKLPSPAIDGTNFTVSFLRSTASKTPDTSVIIEVGTTLDSWPLSYNVATAPEVTSIPLNDDWERVTLTIPRGTDTRKFSRLVVGIN